jgi:hypothetical protein
MNYVQKYKPEYNILTVATSTLGFKHSEDTKIKMSENFSEERKIKIGHLNRNKRFSEKEREVMRKAAFLKYKNQPGLKIRISNA